jgi:hypothetical protein
MKHVLMAAVVAAGLTGIGVGSALADKTWNSDPSTYSSPQSSYGQVYCNADGTQCWTGD